VVRVRLFKRGDIFWVSSTSKGIRRRWSLRTRDSVIAAGLRRAIQGEGEKAQRIAALHSLASDVAKEISPPTNVVINRSRKRLISLQYTYDLDFEKLDAIIAKQSGLCLLCFQPLGSDVCVDHFHNDDPQAQIEVRGVLHRGCNAALGMIESRGPGWLRNALKYIHWTL
jgi:hypothetical protein